MNALGHELRGYVDSDPKKLGAVVEPLEASVTHLEKQLEDHLKQTRSYPDGVDAMALGIGDNRLRQDRVARLEGLDVPPLVHPSASVSPAARLGRGCVISPLAVVNAGAWTGDGVIVNSGAIVEHDCRLQTAVHVSPGAVLCGGVQVGERSWIGAVATVIHGITIGADSTVGAGSTVIRDVEEWSTVVGTPARSKGIQRKGMRACRS